MGVSDDLSDDAIMRSIRAARAGNAIWKELLPILKRAERELIAKIEEIGGTRSFQSARAERMLREVRRTIDGGAKQFFERLEVAGIDLSSIEGEATANSLIKHVPVDYDFTVPSDRLLKSVATELPFEGAILKDHISKWSADTIFRMQGELRTALLQGETIEQMQKRLRGVAEIKIDNARTLARTYAAHVTNAARAETYLANADVIEAEMWTATLDDRTCIRCGPLDNRVYPIGKGPKPPLHFACRCVRVAVIKGRDDLIEAGLLKPGSRASVDGQVPESLKFEDWLRKQSEGRQREVLGAKRLELWKNGTKLDKFVNDENEVIPLSQLAGAAGPRAPRAPRATRSAAGGAARSAARNISTAPAAQVAPKPNIAFQTTKLRVDDGPDPGSVVSYKRAPSAQQKWALGEYKADDYSTINEVLRGQRASYESVQERISSLDGALRGASLREATTLYRGVSDKTLASIGSDAIGTSFNVKTFQSTSLSRGRATRFAVDGKGRENPVLLKIYAQKGASAIDMDRYGKGYTSQEREVLLPRDATFTIRGVSEETGLDQNGKLVTLKIVEVDLG